MRSIAVQGLNKPGNFQDNQGGAMPSCDAGPRQHWDPFPSSLLEVNLGLGVQEGQNYGSQAVPPLDNILPLESQSASLPARQAPQWPNSVYCSLAPIISLPEVVNRAAPPWASTEQALTISLPARIICFSQGQQPDMAKMLFAFWLALILPALH